MHPASIASPNVSPPSSIRQAVMDLPIPRKLILIVGLFCIDVFVLLSLGYFGMEVLSSARAYVGGESLWSKGQKQAVLRLGRFAWSHNDKEYQEYLKALEIPLGDRQARLELEKRIPDFDAAATGFLRGGNHPKDIPGMIHLFRRYRHVSYISQAIEIWRQGDEYILQLQKVGDQIRRLMSSHHPSLRSLQKLLERAQEINLQVTPLENAFSSTMGEGTRWLQNVLMSIMILTAALFLGVTLIIAYLISRHLCDEIDHLRAGAARIAGGDYDFSMAADSRDEIGDLTRSFQQMMDQRREVVRLKDEFYAGIVAANKELEAFSYSVSHDLRAPLRAIDGFSREVLTHCEAQLDARGKEDLARVRTATQRMGQLIDDLLKLSRLTRSELKYEKVDLSAQIHDILQGLQKSDPKSTEDWEITPQVMVQGDPDLLRIALENLIQNAWKFTRLKPHPKIEFGTLNQNGSRVYYVRDNGVGFNMAYAEKLFKPFQRLHDAKEFPGTGIGLALVQRIIHRHGGKVWVESEENKGATFYFTLS